MKCEEIFEFFSAYLDGELEPRDKALVDEHLGQCPRCRREFGGFENSMEKLSRAIVRGRPDTDELARKVISSINAGIEPRKSQKKSSVFRFYAAAFVSAAAGFLLALTFFAQTPVRESNMEAIKPRPTGIQNVPKPELPAVFALTTKTNETGINNARVEVSHGCPFNTEADSKAIMFLAEDADLCMNNSTEIQLSAANNALLEDGEVLLRIIEGKNKPFMLKSRYGTFSTDNAIAHFIFTEQGTLVSVFAGNIVFCYADSPDSPITLKSGIQTMLHSNKHVSQANLHFPSYHSVLWTVELLYKKSPDDPFLAEIVTALIDKLSSGHMQNLAEEDIRAIGPYACLQLERFVASEKSKTLTDARSNAARILADIGDCRTINSWIVLLNDAQPEVRYYSAKGLSRVTGEDFGIRSDFWLNPDPEKLAEVVDYWKQWMMLRNK
ncbi:MAG: zf-HC2 domain-containing protein [Planctomycetes bacterium]|nr:zf-HC2 domain-containing protein [Planctomycetota bacterium]